MNSFGSSCTRGKARCSCTHSPFPLQEKWWARRPFLAIAVLPWGRDDAKWSHFSYPFCYVQIYVFVPAMCWDFSSGDLNFCKCSLVHRQLSKSVSQGCLYSDWEGLKVPQLWLRSVCLLPNTARQASSQVPWYIVWNPTAPTKALWMDAEVLFWGRMSLFYKECQRLQLYWHFLLFSLETCKTVIALV